MSIDQRTSYETRDEILQLLSPEELGAVAMTDEERIPEGDEYLDLEHLDLGVLRAGASTSNKHALPRTSVSDETWSKILTVLETPSA